MGLKAAKNQKVNVKENQVKIMREKNVRGKK